MRVFFLTLILVIAAFPAESQEVSFFTGPVLDVTAHERSYGWQLEYAQRLSEYFRYSLSYLNEGHATTEHRDGFAGQVWASTDVFNPRFVLGAGIGPYYYLNTLSSDVSDLHGWGGVASTDIAWHARGPWLIRIRINWIEARRAETLSTYFGVGYLLEPSPPAPASATGSVREPVRNEITVFLGETIVNNPDRTGHYSYAESVEYRRGVWPYVDWTASWIHENKNNLIERSGFATQIWGVRPFFNGRLTLGAGIGPYMARDRMHDDHSGKSFVAGLGTITTSYRFHRRWDARFSWNRVITDYDRDSDLLMLGIGYRF